MTEAVSLASLGVGESLCVSEVCGELHMCQRLYDLGVMGGTVIRCAMVSPLGDPKAYEIRGAVIALRREDADKIYGKIIKRCDDGVCGHDG